jgi:hypothetical protein
MRLRQHDRFVQAEYREQKPDIDEDREEGLRFLFGFLLQTVTRVFGHCGSTKDAEPEVYR